MPKRKGLFLSHSKEDNAFVHALDEKLRDWGHDTFLDFHGIPGGARWEEEIYGALRKSAAFLLCATPSSMDSAWVFAEIILARFGGIPVIPLIVRPCDLPEFLGDTQHIPFHSDLEAAYEKLRDALTALGPTPEGGSWEPDKPPFPGLMALDEEHSAVFFGRESEVHQTIETLRPTVRRRRFLALVGASGCGKSSLLRAGVIPRLRAGAIAGSERWCYLQPIAPRRAPFRSLATSLREADSSLGLVQEIEDRLREPEGVLKEILNIRLSEGASVALTIDQFEEIERLTPRDEADLFLRRLREALDDPDHPLIVLAALRSDFITACLQFDPLSSLLREGTQVIGPMSRDSMRLAIQEPAERGGFEYEQGLVERILDETQHSDALPLLAYTLSLLWSRMDPETRVITRAMLDELGGVAGALRMTAQAVYERMPGPAREDLLGALTELADVNEQGHFTRRPMPLDQLPELAREPLEELVGARLLTSSTSEDGRSIISVTHEALFHNWPLLTAQLQGASESMRLRRDVVRASEEWKAARRDADYLWRGERVRQAKKLQPSKDGAGEDLAAEFLRASEDLEARALRRESELLGQRVLSANDLEPERSVLLAVAALEEYAWTPFAELALHTALFGLRERRCCRHGGPVARAVLSPDRKLVATASEDRTACLWDAGTGERVQELRGHGAPVLDVAFDPSGKRVVTSSQDAMAFVWSAETGKRVTVLEGHRERVVGAWFSSDGTRVATASNDKEARVWDAATGDPVAVLRGHRGLVRCAAFDSSGRYVLTASHDGTVRLWDADIGTELRRFVGHEPPVARATFSPSGKEFVTASGDRTARVWDLDAAMKQRSDDEVHEGSVLAGHGDVVLHASFSPDGKRIVTTSRDGTARLWDARTKQLIEVLHGHKGWVLTAAFDHIQERMATGGVDRTVRIWDARNGAPLEVFRGHGGPVLTVAFGDERTLVSASQDASARLWDVRSHDELHVLRSHTDWIDRARFSPDGGLVATGSHDGTARVWETKTGAPLAVLQHDHSVLDVAFSAGGARLVTASADGTARLWEPRKGVAEAVFQGHRDRVVSARFNSRGDHVVTSSEDETARVWDVSGELVSVFEGHRSPLTQGDFVRNGSVVTAGRDGKVHIWDASSGEGVAELRGHKKPVVVTTVDPDGRWLLTACQGGVFCVWDARTGDRLSRIHERGRAMTCACFHPEGTMIATGSDDGTAWIRSCPDGANLFVLSEHEARVTSVSFSPDGKRLITTSDDRMARLWDSSSGALVHVLRGHQAPVQNAVFHPDGVRIVTTSEDGTARIWLDRSGRELLDFSRRRTTRDLEAEERRHFGLPEKRSVEA